MARLHFDLARGLGERAPGGGVAAGFCELPLDWSPAEFRIKLATLPWEREAAHALRRAVFCAEQRVFEHDDRDAIDEHAELIVATACLAGEPQQVVGTVRIHRAAPRHWWGSRLAVAADWRRHGRLGATLIRLAVTTANARGCDEFLAHVQAQNEPLFRRLGWTTLGRETLHGREHCRMRADLAVYPPHPAPEAGFVLRPGAGR
ncbi:MSMEG_0567/Sll0786 family nitrogen starvation N-acetyltransferase [Derxia gummosa]|uniref:MSMEG_0567/Sll0786 family nitrogen starvation N-acetyltransferase n=1 Tax=Derxia gummosa DSM 723 TaxID=1121388 RepID=A0A8B6XB23_9BURK|nr:MSMEG_0567/Sll0786 family nitrogen starvation N-acetyltransferase [Derxia gummosa]